MKFYIGIDGGGTKTKCVLTDDQLNVLQTQDAGAANPLTAGFEKSADCLFNLVVSIIKKEKIELDVIELLSIGIAGVGRIENKELLKKNISEKFSFSKNIIERIKIYSDAEIALEGAFNGKAGVVLIAGTGSIIYGKDEYGKIFRIGGFGKTIGDEGSGYAISRKGFSAIAKCFDGRGEETSLVNKINLHFRIKDSNQLINNINTNNFEIAVLAKYIIECADEGDNVCKNILDQESDELILHITAVKKFMETERLNLCLSGSLLTHKNYYLKLVQTKIVQSFPQINLQAAIYPPEVGAILLAKKSV